ncbi:MAG: helix-hairpin-helix domain-containing protein, partial [Pedobacter sp.]
MNSDIRSYGLILLLFFMGCKAGFSQANNDELIEQILESIAPNFSEDHDYSEIAERLNSYRKNPINLNLAGKEQLQDLYFISPLQINSIISHREKNGLFLDVLELQSLPEFDPQTVRWLMNFVAVVPPGQLASASVKKLFAKAEHDLILRFGQVLEKQSGFSGSYLNEDQKYAGSAMRMFTRYRYNYSNTLFASVNLEKDAGERSFGGIGNKGFDFYSANISYKGIGAVRKLLAGDYALQFGQGLTMWAGSGFGKGAGLSTIAKQDIGLRPYSSANEALFLRGVSAIIGIGRFLFTPFYSGRKIDVSLSDSLQEISSMALSGLHRTKNEILNKHAASQRVYGSNVQYSSKDLSAG